MMDEVSSKTEILAAIKSNLTASLKFADLHTESVPHRGMPYGSQTSGPGAASTATLVDEFCHNLEAVGGKAVRVRRTEQLGPALQSILDEIGPRRIAVSDSKSVRSSISTIHTGAEIIACASSAELFECGVGVTAAQWAIAETGTLVLDSDQEASRLTSLVPECHVCIVPAANIRATMSEILQFLETRLSPAVTFVTGPSR